MTTGPGPLVLEDAERSIAQPADLASVRAHAEQVVRQLTTEA